MTMDTPQENMPRQTGGIASPAPVPGDAREHGQGDVAYGAQGDGAVPFGKVGYVSTGGPVAAHFKDDVPARARHRLPLIITAVLLTILALGYGAGVLLFGDACYPNTSIAGIDVSLMGRSTAISRVESSAGHYRLTIEGDGFSWSYAPQSAGEVIDAAAAVDRVIAANEPFAWPVKVFDSLAARSSALSVNARDKDVGQVKLDEIELPAAFDRAAFLADLDTALDAFNEGRTGTFDAAGAYDAEAGKFTLEKAHSNRKLDKMAIDRAALIAISRLSKRLVLDEHSFEPLAQGASDSKLQTAIDAANALIGTDVDLKMGGAHIATLDGETFAQWMTFDENLTPTLDTTPLTQWASELAQAKLDTVGCERTYTRPDGKVVTVSGGPYGWSSNEAELIKMLHDAAANKQIGEIEVPTVQQAAMWTAKGEKDWGAYCDIDLSEQHCRYYDAAGNLLWESGCVTGNPNKGDATPTGVFYLNAKRQNEMLIGFDEDDDGEPDYRSPVRYWMPFVGNTIGLHDASWQPVSVFSNPQAYFWAGSHGCINLPTDQASALYGIIGVGDCVIVHL